MNEKRRFAGIGNRKIDNRTRYAIRTCSRIIQQKGYTLVSGDAIGFDKEIQSNFPEHQKNIFRAKDATPEAIKVARGFHPAWENCSDYARALLGRNAMIILGEDLKTPVEFVFCSCVDEERGGTALSLKIARSHKIPIFNLANENGLDVIKFID